MKKMSESEIIQAAKELLKNSHTEMLFERVKVWDIYSPAIKAVDRVTNQVHDVPNTYMRDFEKCWIADKAFVRGIEPNYPEKYSAVWVPSVYLNTEPDGVCCFADVVGNEVLHEYLEAY